jgi:hypothetical protein
MAEGHRQEEARSCKAPGVRRPIPEGTRLEISFDESARSDWSSARTPSG